MQDEPTPEELIKAVADFLRNDIAPLISGHNAFKLRVAINALDLVTRQLEAGRGQRCGGTRAGCRNCSASRARSANSTACSPIASPSGEVDLQTPGLAEHLWQTTMDKLAVDQPNYGSYKRELGDEVARYARAVIPGACAARTRQSRRSVVPASADQCDARAPRPE